ncbi:MAG: Bax inhibitor-1/YccA family protein [Dysgonamonadaceae bacterium]|nr:Bax inhibitor-1/YccA family protein [Dysgonamonadaceae bacterium]
MTRVYMWMSFALILTAITAYIISQSESAIYFIFANKPVFYGLIIGELVLVVIISSAINKLSVQISSLLFVLYSILTGITISSIFVIFTEGSIASTFLIAALTFGAMSIFGATTKKDLTKWGNILIMALAGLIIASIVNLFFSNSTLYWITTYAGVLIFVGLIAYDTQKLKRLGNQIHGNNEIAKLSILGALTLYLDFINLFLYLLRIFGRKK